MNNSFVKEHGRGEQPGHLIQPNTGKKPGVFQKEGGDRSGRMGRESKKRLAAMERQTPQGEPGCRCVRQTTEEASRGVALGTERDSGERNLDVGDLTPNKEGVHRAIGKVGRVSPSKRKNIKQNIHPKDQATQSWGKRRGRGEGGSKENL